MFRNLKRRKKVLVLMTSFFALLCIIGGGIILFRHGFTPPITDAQGRVIPGSIASLEKIQLGGVEQWILIRGDDTTKPILLFLHGGPGTSQMVLERPYLGKLEKSFVVVEWDQRGAGKSYPAIVPNADINIQQFISDTHELTELLCQRFHQKKIYLIGHSWGSIVGIMTAQKYPDSYYAYIGIGQVANMQENVKLSHEWTLQQAEQAGNANDVATLRAIGEPPYTGDWMTKLTTKQKLLRKYGGEVYGNSQGAQEFYMAAFLKSLQEYTLMDKINFFRGGSDSTRLLWPELMQVDLPHQVPALKVPVYFLEGRHDYETPFPLSEQYYESLEAPHKGLIWFDHSAHMLDFEEFDKFQDVLLHDILPATYTP